LQEWLIVGPKRIKTESDSESCLFSAAWGGRSGSSEGLYQLMAGVTLIHYGHGKSSQQFFQRVMDSMMFQICGLVCLRRANDGTHNCRPVCLQEPSEGTYNRRLVCLRRASNRTHNYRRVCFRKGNHSPSELLLEQTQEFTTADLVVFHQQANNCRFERLSALPVTINRSLCVRFHRHS